MKTKILIFIISIKSVLSFAQTDILDSTFSDDGIATTFPNSFVNSIAVQSDGKILVGGTNGANNFAVARFKSNGTLDSTFSADGKVTTHVGNGVNRNGALYIQPDGKILLSGEAYTNNTGYDFAIVRYNPDGTLDNSFNGTGKKTTALTSTINSDNGTGITMQVDGKIIQVGGTEISSMDTEFGIIRLTPNGSLDNTFGNGGKVFFQMLGVQSVAKSVVVQPDGKILVGGYSNNSGGSGCFSLARLNSNGTLDNTFGMNGKVFTFYGNADSNDYSAGYSMALQPDGKILMTGFAGVATIPNCPIPIIRYNSNGTLDNSFGIGGKVTTYIPNYIFIDMRAIVLQQDGKILVGGGCDNDDSSYYNLLARYNTNGVLDSAFGVNGLFMNKIDWYDNAIMDLAMQSDGKILAASVSSPFGFAAMRLLSGLEVGVIDLSASDNPILIYPNPIQSQATLQYTLIQEEQISIELYDMQGKLVQTFITNATQTIGKHEEVLHLNELLPAGSYILSIGNGKNSQGIKIVKE